jgi:hypothetical protein
VSAALGVQRLPSLAPGLQILGQQISPAVRYLHQPCYLFDDVLLWLQAVCEAVCMKAHEKTHKDTDALSR